jgi:aryl-alcohol dehydrogenase-like predicted oxidoreductase
MEHIILRNSDLKISRITFGAWAIGGWMWGGADDNDALDAINAAVDGGITTIDTAAVYGFGHSEKLVGEAIKGKRDKLQILTKYGLRWDDTKGQYYFKTASNEGKILDVYKFASKESVIRECEISLKNLGTDYIDLYQIHWPDPTTPVQETMEAIEIL